MSSGVNEEVAGGGGGGWGGGGGVGVVFFFFKQKTAYEIYQCDWSSDVCSSDLEVFKIIGQLMIKTEKSKIKEELENKKKMLELRTKTIETQETSLTKQLEILRDEVMKTMKK